MNYYNPYFYTIPTAMSNIPKVGLFSRIFGNGFSFSGILNGTQKALNFANQAIPLVKEVKPMIGNAKTMFKVMNEFKRSEKNEAITKVSNNVVSNTESNNINKNTINNNINSNNGPTFFI